MQSTPPPHRNSGQIHENLSFPVTDKTKGRDLSIQSDLEQSKGKPTSLEFNSSFEKQIKRQEVGSGEVSGQDQEDTKRS